MQFTLRPAGAGDYSWLWELKRLTMREYVEQTWGYWDDAAQEAFFRRSYRPDIVQLVLLDGRNAGLLHVEREPDELFLANIQIHPAFQNRGLGTAVIENVMESARALRLPIRLHVLQVNQAAQHLYQRLGFRVSSTTSTHVVMRWRPAAAASEFESGDEAL